MLTDTNAIQQQGYTNGARPQTPQEIPTEWGDPTLEHIAASMRAHPGDRDAWDKAVEEAAEALTAMGNAHWYIGDLATIVASDSGYGTNAITNFARDINESEGKVREWRTVSSFWTFQRRREFLGYEFLTYSHYRVAMRMKDDAEQFLYTCLDEGWNVERARVEIKRILGEKITPPKLLTAHGRIIGVRPREGDDSSGHLVLDLLKGVNWYPLQDALNDKTLITVTIKVASDATVDKVSGNSVGADISG